MKCTRIYPRGKEAGSRVDQRYATAAVQKNVGKMQIDLFTLPNIYCTYIHLITRNIQLQLKIILCICPAYKQRNVYLCRRISNVKSQLRSEGSMAEVLFVEWIKSKLHFFRVTVTLDPQEMDFCTEADDKMGVIFLSQVTNVIFEGWYFCTYFLSLEPTVAK